MTVSAIGHNAAGPLPTSGWFVITAKRKPARFSPVKTSRRLKIKSEVLQSLPFRLPALQDRTADEAVPDDNLKDADRGRPCVFL
jgi:hypothetical protein